MVMLPVPGAALVYDEVGDGVPLVLVHGTGADASTWDGVVPALAAAGHRVVTYDRRGYRRSTHPPVRDYRLHVDDLAALIEDVGGAAHVLGWSSGGNTALALSIERPELFASLVVLEAPWHGLRHATPSLLGALGRAKLAQARGHREQAATAFFRWASGRQDGGNGFDDAEPEQQQALLANSANVLAELDPHPHGLMMEHLATSRLAGTGVPTTWLLGERSRDWYRRLQSRVVHAAPSIRTVWVPGASHLAHLDAPEAFVSAVLDAVDASR